MFVLIIVTIYLSFVAGVVFVCHRLKRGWRTKSLVVVILLLAPFWDVIIAKGIMWNFARKNAPLQSISQTVEKPESVIWIDNVWPGFDEYGRHWMVESYLDGVHLKTLALNDGKGKLYVYRATAEDFAASAKLWPEVVEAQNKFEDLYQKAGRRTTKEIVPYQFDALKKRDAFQKLRKQEATVVLKRAENYPFTEGDSSAVDLDQFQYKVQFNPIPLTAWQAKFVWCDNLEIRDQQNNILISDNKRCLEYTPMTALTYQGGSPFEGGLMLGEERTYEFDDKVLFEYADVRGTHWTKDSLSRKTYHRNFLDWKKQLNKERGQNGQ